MPPPTSSSFTIKANPGGLLGVLTTQCHISGVILAPAPGAVAPTSHSFVAIWDTGAQCSVITAGVAAACGLTPTGVTNVTGVHGGAKLCFTYLVNIRLLNGVEVRGVRVAEGQLQGGIHGDVLIGMDIITLGDFAITNKGGNTWFSFRTPSQLSTDYVADHNAAVQRTLNHGHGGTRKPKPGKKFGRQKK